VIADKIHNSLALDYPADRLEIVIATDGCSDSTATIVRQLAQTQAQGRVRLLDFPVNRGKVAVLNDAVPLLTGDIVVFSDASSMLAPDAVRRLSANFADHSVGAVSGVYRVLNQQQTALGVPEAFYWRYETFLKLQEARLGCMLGAHGSLFAIRKHLYPVLPPTTINDDFLIPLRVVEQGYRVSYEPAAVAYEQAHEMEGFGRRVRIATGNVEQLMAIPALLRPLRPMVLFCFLSHKAGRLLVPVAMLVAAVATVELWHQSFYAFMAFVQILFYVAALVGAFVPLKPRFLRLPYYFCMINGALFAWLYRAAVLRQIIPSRREMDRLGRRKSKLSFSNHPSAGGSLAVGETGLEPLAPRPTDNPDFSLPWINQSVENAAGERVKAENGTSTRICQQDSPPAPGRGTTEEAEYDGTTERSG
jgi:cellulose synthase/poly-beta-1,6-N-acetylglucosamine synthase-like glycosyltransferase